MNKKGLGAKSTENGFIEEHKAPVLMKTIDPTDTEAIRRELIEFEKSMVGESVEHACVITKEGKIYHCYGTADRVYPDFDLGDELEGAYVTHNHTSKETAYSFSNDDFIMFEAQKLEILRGCDEKYIYELNRNSLDIDTEPYNWQDFENVQHTKMIISATDTGVGYRRWKR